MRARRNWWFIAALALAGLLLKALLLTPWVAGKVEGAADAALAAEGLSGVSYAGIDGVSGIGADGLNVVLEGPAANEAAAVAAVEATDEVNKVVYRPTGEAVEETTPETTVASTTTTAAPVELAPADVSIDLADGEAVTLTGVVADQATRQALVAAAAAEYGEENVTDRLEVDGEGVTNEGGVLTLTGVAATEGQKVGWVAAGLAAAEPAGLQVVDEIEVVSITDSLNSLFALEPIEFDQNRATIRQSSFATLDAAAEAINNNPDAGSLLIVGHTDSDGPANYNQALSQERAEAVRDYLVDEGGVDEARLDAEGRGETELLVEPETSPEDKQRNRRIAWEVQS